MPPIATESCRDITTNITNLLVDSVAPMAPTRIIFLISRGLRTSERSHDQTTLVSKIMDFHGFSRISENFCYPWWLDRMTSPRCIDLEKSKNIMPGGAIGATESRNKLGMLVVMPLQQLSIAFGAPKRDFQEV